MIRQRKKQRMPRNLVQPTLVGMPRDLVVRPFEVEQTIPVADQLQDYPRDSRETKVESCFWRVSRLQLLVVLLGVINGYFAQASCALCHNGAGDGDCILFPGAGCVNPGLTVYCTDGGPNGAFPVTSCQAPCMANCDVCTNGMGCITCNSGFCFTGIACEACIANCDVCTNGTSCTTCNSGFYFNGTDCKAPKCSITNGTASSASYPCTCGNSVCTNGNVCVSSSSSCEAATGLIINGFCAEKGMCNGDYSLLGSTASSAPYYKKIGEATYIFYDPDCNGLGAAGRWICSASVPDVLKASDLDNDGGCGYHGRINSPDTAGPPIGENTWRVACGSSWSDVSVRVETTQVSCLAYGCPFGFGINNPASTNYTQDNCCKALALYCLRITIGHGVENAGTVDVSVDSGSGLVSESSGIYWQVGALVLQKCYTGNIASVQVLNPTNDAWTGSIEYSVDAGTTYQPMTCANCIGMNATWQIVVDGDASGASQARTQCLGGIACSITQALFREVRFVPTKLRSNTVDGVQIAEIEFNASGRMANMQGVTVTNPGGNFPGGEPPENVVDGDINTKWFDYNKGALVITWPTNLGLNSFRFTTANDVEDRDPIQWRVEGRTDVNWTSLHVQTIDYATPVARLTATDWFQLQLQASCGWGYVCPTGFASQNQESTNLTHDNCCQACSLDCVACVNARVCLACGNGRYLENSTCVEACPPTDPGG